MKYDGNRNCYHVVLDFRLSGEYVGLEIEKNNNKRILIPNSDIHEFQQSKIRILVTLVLALISVLLLPFHF